MLEKNKDLKLKWSKLNGIFNRTMGLRRDADIVVSHGYLKMLERPTNQSLPKEKEKFANYTSQNFKSSINIKKAPVIW